MYGTIEFPNVHELAAFLGSFSGTCTAVFKVTRNTQTGRYILEFTGGY